MGLYHKDVFMPDEMIRECPKLYSGKLESTKHFLDRCRGRLDKYVFNHDTFDDIIQDIKETKPEPFEIETDEKGRVVKCCIRHYFDDYRDICIVFRKNTIVTIWFNAASDNHYTLDKSKYDTTWNLAK